MNKRAPETDAKLNRLYDAIGNGIADLTDLRLKDRVTELKIVRAEDALSRSGPHHGC